MKENNHNVFGITRRCVCYSNISLQFSLKPLLGAMLYPDTFVNYFVPFSVSKYSILPQKI